MKSYLSLLIHLISFSALQSQARLDELLLKLDSIDTTIKVHTIYSQEDSVYIISIPDNIIDNLYQMYERSKLLIEQLMFHCDSTMADKVNKYDWIMEFFQDHHFSGFRNIKYSFEYCNLKGIELLDSLIVNQSDLLCYVRESIDSTYFMNKILSEKNHEIIQHLVYYYYNSGFESPDPSDILHLYISYPETYIRLFHTIRFRRGSNGSVDTTLTTSEIKFFQENPHYLEDSTLLFFYRHELLDIPTEEEIQYAKRNEIERLYLDSMKVVKAMEDEIAFRLSDSLKYAHYYDTLTGLVKLEYFNWLDSAIKERDIQLRDESRDFYLHDLGSLSNQALIDRFFLLKMNDRLALILNADDDKILVGAYYQLDRISQILGDRFLNHTLDRNEPNLKMALDQFDEFVVKVYSIESKNLDRIKKVIYDYYLNFWLLVEPYLISRIDSCQIIYGLDFSIWHNMMNEPTLKYLYIKADEAISKGDIKKAKCYISPMHTFTANPDLSSCGLPAGRKVFRDIEISYEWYEKYLLPLEQRLDKYKY
jgi:hypothetical protein